MLLVIILIIGVVILIYYYKEQRNYKRSQAEAWAKYDEWNQQMRQLSHPKTAIGDYNYNTCWLCGNTVVGQNIYYVHKDCFLFAEEYHWAYYAYYTKWIEKYGNDYGNPSFNDFIERYYFLYDLYDNKVNDQVIMCTACAEKHCCICSQYTGPGDFWERHKEYQRKN